MPNPVCSVEFIHSSAGLRVPLSVYYFQNQRMRKRGSFFPLNLFWGHTYRLWMFPCSAPYVVVLEVNSIENINKQNSTVHKDDCVA